MKCLTENCEKEARTRGFCVACYYRNLRNGKIQAGAQTKKWKHRISNIDIDSKTADCANCGKVKITRRDNNLWRCSVDVNDRSRDYKRAYRAVKRECLIDHCEICNSKDKLCYDHNHETGEFRGTLCPTCNTGIGLFYDNTDLLKKAVEYLHARASSPSEKESL